MGEECELTLDEDARVEATIREMLQERRVKLARAEGLVEGLEIGLRALIEHMRELAYEPRRRAINQREERQ